MPSSQPTSSTQPAKACNRRMVLALGGGPRFPILGTYGDSKAIRSGSISMHLPPSQERSRYSTSPVVLAWKSSAPQRGSSPGLPDAQPVIAPVSKVKIITGESAGYASSSSGGSALI